MSGETSEEKTLNASQKKLNDARSKGQLAKSNDFIMMLGLVSSTLYIWLSFPRISANFKKLMIDTMDLSFVQFDLHLARLFQNAVIIIGEAVIPFFLIIFISSILGNLFLNKGFIFSTDPLMPKMERINPMAGFKRMLGMKSQVELIKSILKIIILIGAITVVNLNTTNEIVRFANCGLNCAVGGMIYVIMKTLIVCLLVFIISGIIDVLLQQSIFLRDMRMTKTEQKQEIKNAMGDPRIKSAHKRIRNESANARRLGIRQSSVVVFGNGFAVGVRYVKGETQIPLIVARHKGDKVMSTLREARNFDVSVYEDATLAKMLYEDLRPGNFIQNKHFDSTAKAIMSA